MPGVRNTAVRKEPSFAESNAARAAILGRATDESSAKPAPQPVTQLATPPVSGSGPSKSPIKARPAAQMPTPEATAPSASNSTTQTELTAPVPSSPEQKPDVANLDRVASLPPQAGPSTPRAIAVPDEVANAVAMATAKSEQISPPKFETTPSRLGKSTPRVKSEVIDLTQDSEAEGEGEAGGQDSEEENKKNIIAKQSPATTAAQDAMIAKRKSAHEHAEELLTELDICDVDNVAALIKVGFKSTETFVKRLSKLDKGDEYRTSILQELRREMGQLDFGLLRAFLKKSGLEME